MNKKLPTFFRIDDQVFFSMAGLSIFALLILAFRYATHHECSPIKLQVVTDNLIAENNITFKAESTGATSYYWDFGDSVTKNEQTYSTNHIYKKGGHYWVRVLVNGECSEFTDVVIDEKHVNVSPLLPMIAGPDTAYLHEAVTYTDTSPNSTVWDWRFGETSGTDGVNRKATYTYLTPGSKKILLEINSNPNLTNEKIIIVIDRQAQKKITAKLNQENPRPPKVILLHEKPQEEPLIKQQQAEPVKPKEEEQPKAKPRAPDISVELFKSMLYEVADGTKRASDFSSYLCNNLSMEISFDNKVVTFTKMCEELKKLGKKKIKDFPSIIIQPNPETNCIKTITVSIKRKGFLGL
ncbi:MAG TPA: PKD domain-containing protein [Puia sp.]|jgi:hypothetical protein|nr:PKD domain-containing protein [Puia sp.]